MRFVASTLAMALVVTTALTSGCGGGGGFGGRSGAGGGGGGAAGAGGGAMVNCDAISDPIDPTALLDDMEAPDNLAPRVAGRAGAWWAGGDPESTAAGASIQPNGDAPAEAIPGGRCGSMYAMRVTGQGFASWAVLTLSMGWGSVDGGAEQLLPHDATGRRGVTFWARIGDTSTNQVRVSFSDRYSRPEGGICVENGPIGMDCFDNFGVDLTQLSTTWKPYRIPFVGLTQRDFGVPRDALDLSAIYSVEFLPAPSTTFDFWVDDINFY
jgi:hypothetical protein